jgi:cyclohexanecarboxylate-CoA ligase
MVEATHIDHEWRAEYRATGNWPGVLVDSHAMTLAREFPDAVAIVDGDRTLTYAEFDRLVVSLACALRRLGIGHGDVVAWQLPNWYEALVIHHAAMRLGAISNPIVPIYRQREVTFILKQNRAKVVFAPALFRKFNYVDMYKGLRASLPDLGAVIAVRGTHSSADDSFDGLVRQRPVDLATAPRHADDIALLLYTSGTTSDPKGVLHTHNTLEYENQSIIDLFDLSRDDIVFMPSPVTHITGVLYGLQLPFMIGAKVVLQDVWNPAEAVKLMATHRTTFMIAATPFLHGLVESIEAGTADISSMRYFGCGGADVPPSLITKAEEIVGCTCLRIYGSTEFPTLTAANSSDSLIKRASTDGRIYASGRAKITDETGVKVPPGQPGELLVQGPELFVGYLDPTLNSDAFDDQGWFRTGDLATFDRDGYLEIVGRKKDIIVRGGEKISAKEIEDLLVRHPMVADVAVIGMPDPIMVERICAYVVLRTNAQLALDSLVEFLRRFDLAAQKLPERIEIIDTLPRTTSGKVQKFKLRSDLATRLASEVSPF